MYHLFINKKKFLLKIVLFSILTNSTFSFEIINIASINKSAVTNIDLINHSRVISIIENREISLKKEGNFILQNLINFKIKEIELTKYPKSIFPNQIYNNIDIILKNYQSLKNISNEEKKILLPNLKNILEIDRKWKFFISQKFQNESTVNLSEVKQKSKTQKQLKKNINIEKNKKIIAYSETYFNEIKRNYYIKIYK